MLSRFFLKMLRNFLKIALKLLSLIILCILCEFLIYLHKDLVVFLHNSSINFFLSVFVYVVR